MRKQFLRFLILIIVLTLYFIWIDIIEILNSVPQINLLLLFLSILIYIFIPLVKSYRFGTLIPSSLDIHKQKLIGYHYFVPIIGRITPGKIGEVNKIFMINNGKNKLLFNHIFERILDIILLGLLTIPLLIVLSNSNLNLIFMLFVLIFFLSVIVIWNLDKFLKYFTHYIHKDFQLTNKWFQSNLKEKTNLQIIIFIVFTVSIWTLTFFSSYTLLRSLNIKIGFFIFAGIHATAIILSTISGLPGGFGAREVSFTFLLIQFNLDKTSAAQFSLLLTAFLVILESAFAIISNFVLNIQKE